MENIAVICDTIIIYDVLHKRKVFLDAFSEGLEVFHLKTAINTFPELFRELFVASDACSPNDVLAILQFDEDLGPQEQRVMNYFKKAIQKLNETGIAHLPLFSSLGMQQQLILLASSKDSTLLTFVCTLIVLCVYAFGNVQVLTNGSP